MREIKVRAWHVKQQKMYSAEELGRDQLTLSADGRGFVNVSGESTECSIFYGEGMIPLEYTGLHDKNGQEIYEGDCFKGFIDGEEFTWEIAMDEDRDTLGWSINPGQAETGEVIGNIYHNPELIE